VIYIFGLKRDIDQVQNKSSSHEALASWCD
jgi:hypothetical protein